LRTLERKSEKGARGLRGTYGEGKVSPTGKSLGRNEWEKNYRGQLLYPTLQGKKGAEKKKGGL